MALPYFRRVPQCLYKGTNNRGYKKWNARVFVIPPGRIWQALDASRSGEVIQQKFTLTICTTALLTVVLLEAALVSEAQEALMDHEELEVRTRNKILTRREQLND